jgi:serine/threonine-protein kinase
VLAAEEIVDRFQVIELLGEGGIAQVYKARHRVLGSLHAIKVVTAGGQGVARRLLREGSIQAQLRHPNVVAVTDVIDIRGHTALVLEYVEGITLQQLLMERGVLPVEEALALYAQILAGVGAAHAAGVLHRDLKPANVLLAPGPSGLMAKVADFGLAKVVMDDAPAQPGDTVQGLVMGTPGYMAPEQVGEAATADARADVFALGVLLYEMLCGVQPFTGADVGSTLRNTLRGQYPPLRTMRPDLPAPVLAAVERALALERADRFSDARVLAQALYGDRPELVEVTSGRKVATPVALSIPSDMQLRPAGMGSAAPTPANPTLGPAGFDPTVEEPGGENGEPADSSGGGAAPATPPPGGPAPLDPPSSGETLIREAAPPEPPTPAPARPPSRRWLLSGFGLFAAAAMTTVFVMSRGPALDEVDTRSPSVREERIAEPVAQKPGAGGGASDAGGGPLGAAAPVPDEGGAPEAEAVAGTEAASPPVASKDLGAAAGAPAEPPGSGAPMTGPSVGAAESTTTGTAAPGMDAATGGAETPSSTGASATGTPADPRPEPELPPRTKDESRADDAVVDAAPVDPTAAAAAAAATKLVGGWTGTWSGRPFTLTLVDRGGGRMDARLEVLVGTSYRTFDLTGSVDTQGRFTVMEKSTPGWWVDGVLSGGALSGSLRHPESKKATPYQAKRK